MLYIMVGVPGSGKTTWIRNNLPEAVRVSHDDIYKMMNQKYVPEWKWLYHLVEEWLTQEALFQEKDVVIDRTNLDKKSRERWVIFGKQWTNEIIAVIMTTSLKQAKEWNLNPDRITNKHYVDESVYEKLLTNAKDVTMDEGFTDIIYV